MKSPFLPQGKRPDYAINECSGRSYRPLLILLLSVFVVFASTGVATPQAVTIDTRTGVVTTGDQGTTVDRRYQQVEPTHVALTKSELDPKTRLELIRVMEAEQGFAMRPFPRGHKGLTLIANGKLEPAGESYLNMVTSHGLCAKPGERVVITDVKVERTRIIFDLNGGPDKKHRFLSHVEIGTGPTMNPVVRDNGEEPAGARLSLAFDGHVPELTGRDVKALLAPLISFDVKTPIQAFTDTLPPSLKDAILNHHVLVGMSTEMVLFAKGQPESKTREVENQVPFEEWIYGHAPKEVDFVRINGNRVIRLEVAKMGETPVIFTKDEVAGLMRIDGTALTPNDRETRTIQMGDAARNPDTQAPAAPPSLRKPGETLPADASRNDQVMRPVQFPKPKPAELPGANPDEATGSETESPAVAQPVGSSSRQEKSQTVPPNSPPQWSTTGPSQPK